jgi:succinate dehydrogenase and fumarate reductase iron-sulfur protein
VKAEHDGTLTFRRSCAHGVCGSDAMLINGRNRLACKLRIEKLGKRRITVAPLPGLPVVKDLVVDMDGFFDKLRSVQPYLIADRPAPERERIQSAEEHARYEDTTKCILCAACTTSCPSFWAQPAYVGPAAIVNAGSSSIHAMTRQLSDWRSWPTRMACGAAGRSSTAWMPVRGGSTSPRPSWK